MHGYASGRPDVPIETLMAMHADLTAYAEREGYTLAEIFIEPGDQPATALQAMIDSAHRRDVEAVAITEMTDLGTDPHIQQLACRRLQDAGLRLLIRCGDA